MFEALPASLKAAPPRARAITSALLLHAVLIGLAITSTASSGVSAPHVARDTIRVDLARHRTTTRQRAASDTSAADAVSTERAECSDYGSEVRATTAQLQQPRQYYEDLSHLQCRVA